VFIFDLVPVAEAQVQFEHSWEVVEFLLVCCLRLLMDIEGLVFGFAGATMLPSNMAEACPNCSVSSVAGGSYESSCNYPSAAFDTDWFLVSCCCTTPIGGCATLCGRCVLPLHGCPRVARATGFTSLRTVSCGSHIFKETPASMAFLLCSIVW
jgi:hypothetical protein